MSTAVQSLRARWNALRARPPAGPRGLIWQPPPRAIGSVRVGRRIASGQFMLAGELVEGPDPWDLTPPTSAFEMQLHGMGWLDDLMAAAEADTAPPPGAGAPRADPGAPSLARYAARTWIEGWAARYGSGAGPGWTAALTGRRLLRWISHAPVLLGAMKARDQQRVFDTMYAQAGFLRRHWAEAAPGLARVEALTGLLYAGLTLEGMAELQLEATAALAEAAVEAADGGATAARNPEALAEVALLLGWSVRALREGPVVTPDADDALVPPTLEMSTLRVGAILRALRHADGTLARFHGGGGGQPERLAQALADAPDVPAPDAGQLSMGFATLRRGGTSLVVDAAPPPTGPVSGSAGAATLAFEMTSRAGPVVVSCGPGAAFGPKWHRAGRATASHSTLSLAGHSSSRIGPALDHEGRQIAPLIQRPERVQWQRSRSRDGADVVTLSHDGWVRSHGITHLRRLSLDRDGAALRGEDALRAVRGVDRERLTDAMARGDGVAWDLRFHLHPDAEARLDMGGRAVSIVLPGGEVWVLRPGGRIASSLTIALTPSAYLDARRLHPRPSTQVVFSDRLVAYAATVDWTLSRAQASGR